jgi:hypothetical protein
MSVQLLSLTCLSVDNRLSFFEGFGLNSVDGPGVWPAMGIATVIPLWKLLLDMWVENLKVGEHHTDLGEYSV